MTTATNPTSPEAFVLDTEEVSIRDAGDNVFVLKLKKPEVNLGKEIERMDSSLKNFIEGNHSNKKLGDAKLSIVVDLSEASIISRESINSLVILNNIIRSEGGTKLKLAAANEAIKSSLKSMKVDRIFAAYDSVDEALASVKSAVSR